MTIQRPNLSRVDLTETTWRGRAIRYVVIYLALAGALVAARTLTQDIRPTLRAAQEREAGLLTQRNDLAVQVQILENPQRIRDWAFANGMIRFAEAPKETQVISPPAPPASMAGAASSPEASPEASPESSSDSSVPPDSSPSAASSGAPPPQTDDPVPSEPVPNNPVPNNTVEVRTQWK